jgi:hypothetical protein
VIHKTMAVVVEFLHTFGLSKGELLSTDGPLEPSYARSKGWTYACEGCHACQVDEAGRQALRYQCQSGAKRLELTCPFPAVVAKVRQATAKTGNPKDPTVALLEIEEAPDARASMSERQQVATLLGLPQDAVPPLRLKGCHWRQGSQGELLGRCPKVPSALEAKIGSHVDTKHPSKKEPVFGSLHQKTTDRNQELGLALPLGDSTSAADANEGSQFMEHRATLAVPVLSGQGQLGDAAYDVIVNYCWMHDRGGMAVFDYNRRNEHLDPESLLHRGDDPYGTPYAPCGRLCRSHGYDDQAQSRQYVCGLPCPPEEQQQCPHRYGVLG